MVIRVATLLLVVLVGCADHGGTLVALTITSTVEDPGDDQHFELFASVNGGAVSVRKFEFRVVPSSESILFQKLVVDHLEPDRVLGVVDGFDSFFRPIGGVRFRSPVDLTGASELFVTREGNGDTDPAPSANVIMECDLGARPRGALTCVLTKPGDKSFIQGTAALIVGDDEVNPL